MGGIGGGTTPTVPAMDDTMLRPIEGLEGDWNARRRAGPSVDALRRLAAAEPVIAELQVADLGEVVGRLRQAREGGDPVRAAAVVRAMLRSAAVDPLVPRAILQALVPGLVGVARRLGWGAGGDWEGPSAFFVDLLATAWELVVDWAGDDRPYAVLDLLSAARCRMRRELVRQRRAAGRVVVGLDLSALRPEPWRGGLSDLDELARALDDVVDDEGDRSAAAVLYAHRVLGYSMTELARQTGRSRRYLGQQRDRAAQLLTA